MTNSKARATSGPIQLFAYESGWQILFLEERHQLQASIGESVLDIQHIGSTSIPGVPAKPILDIGIAITNFEEGRPNRRLTHVSTEAGLRKLQLLSNFSGPDGYCHRQKNSMGRTIEVVDHIPEWRAFFEKEAALLTVIFGTQFLAIHHIGSTAIPGIKAKPIIDILVVIKDIESIEMFSAPMRALGYRPRGECLDNSIPGTPGRFYFSKDTDGARSHQVHVCQEGHADIQDKLAFRDYLRLHREEAQAYGMMKERLAARHRDDIVGYIQGKEAFVQNIIARAQLWRHKAQRTVDIHSGKA